MVDDVSIKVRLVANAPPTAPLDTASVMQEAIALLPREGHGNTIQSPALHLAITCRSQQNILRPAEFEAPAMASAQHQRTLVTEALRFDRSKGVESNIDGAALLLEQAAGDYEALLPWNIALSAA